MAQPAKHRNSLKVPRAEERESCQYSSSGYIRWESKAMPRAHMDHHLALPGELNLSFTVTTDSFYAAIIQKRRKFRDTNMESTRLNQPGAMWTNKDLS